MRFAGLVILLAMLATGCASATKDAVGSGERFSSMRSGIEDYTLGAGDHVKLTVFNEPTLSGEFAVNSDGAVSLPLVGDVAAVGKRAPDVAARYQALLADGYVKSPKVSIEITQYRPFFILGEVKTPGQYPYASGMTALNAIAIAQGFTPRAEKSVVFIRRAGTAQEEAFRLTPDLRVLPGDTIRLSEKYF